MVVAIAALAGGGGVGYGAIKSRADQLQAQLTTDLQAGQSELEAGKASLTQANAKRDATLVPAATAHFEAAKEKFLAAGNLADNSRLLRDLELVPSVGDIARSRHTAVSGIAAMGAAVSDAGQDLSALDAQLIKPPPARTAGGSLLTALDQTHASLIAIRSDFDRAQKAAEQVDVQVLPAGQQTTFLKARDTIGAALAGLDEFARLVPVLKDLLGGNGIRTFLIEQVNPAELRPGGGFIGTYSVVQANEGNFAVIKSGDAYELADPRPLPGQRGFVQQQDPLGDVIPNVSWSFVDTNIYPDFPSNARAAEHFAQPRLGPKIDAVISIDYYAVAKMLDLTGPLAVPGYGRTVDAGSLIPLLIQLDLTGNPAHKAILSAIAKTLMPRLSALPASQWPALVVDLNSLAAGRHLQVYFNDAAIEQEMDRIGWSGIVNPVNLPEFMMENESNIGGGKANYFLDRHYTLTLQRDGAVLHHMITVDLVNSQPNPHFPWPDYKAYAGLYVGYGVSTASTNNLARSKNYPKPASPSGMELLEGWLPLVSCCGGRASFVFRYDTPWPVHDRGLHQIYWQKQPGTVSDKIDVIWYDSNRNRHVASGDLSQDRVIALSATGLTLADGHAAQAVLPSLSLG